MKSLRGGDVERKRESLEMGRRRRGWGGEGAEGRRRVIYIGRVTGGTFTPDKGQFSPHFCLI